MCGINGIYGVENIGLANELITKMNSCMEHRGPDDSGVFAQDNMALGHQRLSILDLSSLGKQPMESNDGRFMLSYNGEIYNFAQIKQELNEYPFKTQTDTEMILAAYQKWGKDCLSKFNGMFALAIWDMHEKELFIARDRLGIKPLYYFHQNDTFIFSSEIRSLLASGQVPKKLNKAYLSEFLEYQTVHTPNTLLENVFMLEPGHWMQISSHGVIKKPFWEVDKIKKQDIPPSKSAAEKVVHDLFFESVERRMIADVPLGAFLSGGIDSSAVVAAMSKLSNSQINTFNISFAEKEFSEAAYAKEIATLYNTNHHEIQLTPKDFLEDLPHAMNAMDHPSGDGPNSYVVSKATKKAGITVALSGLGGDELFCGYDVFPLLKKLETSSVSKLPKALRSFLGNSLFALKKGNNTLKIKELLKTDSIDFEHAYPIFRQTLWKEEIEGLLGSYKSQAIERFLLKDDSEIYKKISVAEIQTYMQNTLLRDTDQMSMASALEVRVPFLDHHLVEYILSLPDALKTPTTPKKLFVDSMGNLIPKTIWDRKKMGFTLPWSTWMKQELKMYCVEGLNAFKALDYVNAVHVDVIWNNFLEGKPLYTWTRVWPIVVLGNWIKKNGIEG